MEVAERILRGRRAITIAKERGLDTADWERHLARLLEWAETEPGRGEGFEPWLLWEWQRVSIPQWQDILRWSIEHGNHERESYARWMLKEILLDSQYEDGS